MRHHRNLLYDIVRYRTPIERYFDALRISILDLRIRFKTSTGLPTDSKFENSIMKVGGPSLKEAHLSPRKNFLGGIITQAEGLQTKLVVWKLTLQHSAEESPLCYYPFLNAVFKRCPQISFSTTTPSILYSSLNSSLISVTHDLPLSKHPCHFSIHWAIFNFPTPSNPSSAEVHSPSTSVPTSSQSSK